MYAKVYIYVRLHTPLFGEMLYIRIVYTYTVHTYTDVYTPTASLDIKLYVIYARIRGDLRNKVVTIETPD